MSPSLPLTEAIYGYELPVLTEARITLPVPAPLRMRTPTPLIFTTFVGSTGGIDEVEDDEVFDEVDIFDVDVFDDVGVFDVVVFDEVGVSDVVVFDEDDGVEESSKSRLCSISSGHLIRDNRY